MPYIFLSLIIYFGIQDDLLSILFLFVFLWIAHLSFTILKEIDRLLKKENFIEFLVSFNQTKKLNNGRLVAIITLKK